MNRLEAIKLIINHLRGEEYVIHANGSISRESFNCKNRKKNFYLVGSMGLASSVALGLALSQPQKKIIVLDGDGNVLMGFGNLALIGSLKPKNLIHIVLDNQVYGTTGNQTTISPYLDFSRIAKSCGYKNSYLVKNQDRLSEALIGLRSLQGPHFLHIKVDMEVPLSTSRIPYTSCQIKDRFKKEID
jgi:thiamine pyrophosphate-dependent acetolactate synthase large subunit-like protein